MKIPNVDGIHETRDGSVRIVVTRSDITITMKSQPESKVHIIDDDMHQQDRPGQQGGDGMVTKMHRARKQMDAITDFLIGDK